MVYCKHRKGADKKGKKMKAYFDYENATSTRYAFKSANLGTITIEVETEYSDGLKDVVATIEATNAEKRFYEVCTTEAEDIFCWLVSEGVEFDNASSLYFNLLYVEEALLEGCADFAEVLQIWAGATEERIRWNTENILAAA